MPLWPFGRKSAPSKRDPAAAAAAAAATTITGDRNIKGKSKSKRRQAALDLSPATVPAAAAATPIAGGSGVAVINSSITNSKANNTSTNLHTNTAPEINTVGSSTRRKRKRLSKRNSRGHNSATVSTTTAALFKHEEQQDKERTIATDRRAEVKDTLEQERSVVTPFGDNWTLPLQQPPPTPASRGRLSRSSSVSSSSSPSSSASSSSPASSLALSPQKVDLDLGTTEPTQRHVSTDGVTALPRAFPSDLSPHLRPVTRDRQSKTSGTQSTGTQSGNFTTVTTSSSANLPQRSNSVLSSRHDRRNRFGESNVAAVTAATTTQLRRRLSKKDRHEAQQQERQREAEIREMSAVPAPYQSISDLKRPASRSDVLLSRKNSKKAKNTDKLVQPSTTSLPMHSPLPSTDLTADLNAHAFELGTLETFSPRPALRISLAHHQQQFRDYHYRNYNISDSYTNNGENRSQQHSSMYARSQRHHQQQGQQKQQHDLTDSNLYNLEDDTTSPKTKIKSTRPITPSVTTQQRQKYLSNVTRSLSRRKGKRPDQITERLKRSQHRPVDSLANELDSGALREVMERDQRRREKKRLADAEKAQRRLARKNEQSEHFLQQSRQLQQQREYHLAESQRGSPKQKVRNRRKSGSKSRSRSRKRNVIVENLEEDKENVDIWRQQQQYPPSASLVAPPELSPDLKLVLPPSPPPFSPARKLKGGIVAAAAAAAAVAPTVPLSRNAKEANKAVLHSYAHQQLKDMGPGAAPVAQSTLEHATSTFATKRSGEKTVEHIYSQVQHRETDDAKVNNFSAQNDDEQARSKTNFALTMNDEAETNIDNPATAPEVVVGTARAVRLSQASMSSVGRQLSLTLSSTPPPPSSPPFVPDGLKQQRTMSSSSAAPQQQQQHHLVTLYDTEGSEQQSSERWGSDESKIERRGDNKVINVWNNINITPEPTPPLQVADNNYAAGKETEDVPPVPVMPTHMAHASMESVSDDLKRLQDLQQRQQKEQQERRLREQEWARKLAGRVVSDLSQGSGSAGTTSGTGSRVTSGESAIGQAATAANAPRRNKSLRRGGDGNGGGSTWRSLFRRSGSGRGSRVTSGSNKMGYLAETGVGGDASDGATVAGMATARKHGSSDLSGVGALKRTMTPSEFSFSNTSREEILLLRQSGGDVQSQPQPQQGRSSYQRISGPGAATTNARAGAGAGAGAGGVTRRRSKFREDLPELPLSPPDSRLHSPIESHEAEDSLAAAGFTSSSSRSASGAVPAAAVTAVVAATENMTVAAAASTPQKEAKVHRVVSLAGYGSGGERVSGGAISAGTGELGRSGSGAIGTRRTGRVPANIRVESTSGNGGGAAAAARRAAEARASGFGLDKDLPLTPSHQKTFSATSTSKNDDNITSNDVADPTSTTSLLASPDSEGSWLTGRGTSGLKSGGNEKQRSATQQLHVQYQERLNKAQDAGDVTTAAASAAATSHQYHQDSGRSSQELDDGNVIANDDYFRRLALVQLPAPPPIPDDDPAYSPPSGRIPSSIVVGRAGRSRSRGGSGSSRDASSADSSRNGTGRMEEDEDTVKVPAVNAPSGAGAGTGAMATTTITTTVPASTSPGIKKGLSPLPQVKGLDVGVNAGIAIPPNAEDAYLAQGGSAGYSHISGTDGAAGAGIDTKNAYATEYDYDYYDEGTFVHETEARRPVTLTHRRDAEKIYSREVLLDRTWDEDGSRRGSTVDGAQHGGGNSRRGSALTTATPGGVAAAAARLTGKTDQPALDVVRNERSIVSDNNNSNINKDGEQLSPTYAIVRNARSVDLRNSAEYKHAKRLSAGSVKVLDIGSGGSGSKRQSADSMVAGATGLNTNVNAVSASAAGVAATTTTTTTSTTTTTTTGTASASAVAVAPAFEAMAEQASSADANAHMGQKHGGLSKDAVQAHGGAHGKEIEDDHDDEPARGRSLLSPTSAAAGHSSSELRSSSGGDSYRFL